MLDINLILAASFVHTDGAAHGHVQAVLGAKFHSSQLVFEAHAADLRPFVFESAVDVAGLCLPAIGDFAFDPNIGETSAQKVAHPRGQFADRPDTALRHQ